MGAPLPDVEPMTHTLLLEKPSEEAVVVQERILLADCEDEGDEHLGYCLTTSM